MDWSFFGYALILCCKSFFYQSPFSIDHYLAKELNGFYYFDSPEYLTYIGAFDFLNPIIKHNSKLSNDSLEDAEENHIDTLKHLQRLNSYSDDELTKNQVITKKNSYL